MLIGCTVARCGALSQARVAAGKNHPAGRGDRQDQLRSLAGTGRPAQL